MNFIFKFLILSCFLIPGSKQAFCQQTETRTATAGAENNGVAQRAYWCELLYKMSYPVIHNLAEGTLKKNMPLELGPGYGLKVEKVTYSEAVGRTMAGVAPWLTLPDENSPEGIMRSQLKKDLLKGLVNAFNPESNDYLNFRTEQQPIVDAAFLAHGLLRATAQLWEPLDELTKKRIIEEFKSLRNRKPAYNNWLLFSGITEAFLLKIGEQADPLRIDFAYRKLKEWYAGDGWYKDGEHFAMDYYNSFVIHSMMVDMVAVMLDKKMVKQADYDESVKRMVRYSEFLERVISPEGTYPAFGRSITYRTGVFQALGQVALMEKLPAHIDPAQVRCALTKVMQNMYEQEGTFDEKGWLTLGFAGHQPMIADTYTSTGSLYMSTLGFLPLGLPASNPFWSAPDAEWTGKRAWNGKPFKKDYKISD